jgi:acylphosphatase
LGRNLKVPEGKLAKLFYVSGLVQGVGYRLFAQRVALRLELAGYAKNLLDGRVEVYAIGTLPQLAALREELKRGPWAAEVSDLMEEEAGIEEKYSQDFSIEHDTW